MGAIVNYIVLATEVLPCAEERDLAATFLQTICKDAELNTHNNE